ncbi:MAG: oxygen-independent coproporphyrinogen III oxidase [Bacteroidota bacterium]|nr:oxygen-independent coproporphyrinogen III oxidase [Bacteroidota bacterium]
MNSDILIKYNKPGPRYTSYPPATFFNEKFTSDDFRKSLIASNEEQKDNISLYVHIPFCPRLCYFCGCNTSHFQSKEFVERYIDAVIKEINSVSAYIDKKRKVTQIHWGGGTPNSIPLNLVEKVMNAFKSEFILAEKVEIAMECNPAYLDFEHIDKLANMSFNRLSLGIQDFDINVLNIINRSSSKHPVGELVKYMKDSGFDGVNIDLIYGLPGQTEKSFINTIERTIDISPDRIVTFSYAHVPWFKSAQKILEKSGLPSAEEKLSLFFIALNTLTQKGYIQIGMDHYAKPGDDLSVALNNKMLHRNFQGYCTKKTTGQVYGFGATSISQLNGAYTQNIKNITKYVETIEKSEFAVERGYNLSDIDKIRRDVIDEIMCNGYLNMPAMASEHSVSLGELKNIVDYSPEKLQSFIDDDLLTLNNDILQLKPLGFLVVRNIAMAFDPLLKDTNAHYSKTV